MAGPFLCPNPVCRRFMSSYFGRSQLCRSEGGLGTRVAIAGKSLGETKMSQGSPHSATPDMLLGNFLYVHGETKGQILTLSLHKPAYGVGSIFPDILPDRALDRSTKYAWLDSTSANAIHRAAGHAPGARRCAGRPVLSGRPLRARGGYPRGTGAGPRRWRYR